MKTADFIKKYKKDENFINEIKSCDYISFAAKCEMCDRIIRSTYYTTVSDNTKKFHVDSTAKYMLYRLSLIDTYTKIDIDFKDIVNEYDALAQHGLIDKIIERITRNEYNELSQILEMKEKDIITNEYEPHAFIASQVERFGSLLDLSISPAIDKLISTIDKLDAEQVAKIVAKIVK